MRYYRLKFYTRGGTVIGGNGFNRTGPVIPFEYSSIDSLGRNIPGALDIQFDVTIGLLSNLIGPAHIRIYNPPLDVVKNSIIYQDMRVTLEAGFIQGLPIANRLYALTHGSIVAYGSVVNSFANFVGTDMALDLVLIPSVWFGSPYQSMPGIVGVQPPVNTYPQGISAPNSPRGFTFRWGKGQTYRDAIEQTLRSAGFTMEGTINPLILNNTPGEDFSTTFISIQQFAEWVRNFTKDQINPPTQNSLQPYQGVTMTIKDGNVITIQDGTAQYPAIRLSYEDFIGQPTWQTFPQVIQTVHPMRGDFSINRWLEFPQNLPTSLSPPSGSSFYNQQFLRGVQRSIITQVRHHGRFRDPSPDGWVTTANSITAQQGNT